MPTYEYQCRECKTTFEADQKITDEPLTECARKLCRGRVQRQIPDSTSFTLKGTGWFKTGGY